MPAIASLVSLFLLQQTVLTYPVPQDPELQEIQIPPKIAHRVTAPWADIVIAIAYCAIPVELAFFVMKLPATTLYQKCVGALFVAFILLCGVGHLMDAFGFPQSWVLADRYLTAFVSAITALASPHVFAYSVRAFIKFAEEGRMIEKQRDILCDAQEMAHIGHWEMLYDPETGLKEIEGSDEWFRIMGIRPVENSKIPLSRFRACLDVDTLAQIDRAVAEALQGETFTFEHSIIRECDGREIQIRAFGKPVSQKGRVIALRGTAQDITLQVLAQRELVNAKEAALLESKHKDIFLATMSHELRTPLTSIIGHVELMEETNMSEIQREYMSNAKRAATTLLSLINDVLDYSKLIAGVVELDLVPSNPADVLADIHAITKDLGKQVSLRVDPYTGPALIMDGVRFKQILLNLVSNAVKFTMPGGVVEVSNSWTVDTTDKVHLTFTVRDTGIGMSRQVLTRLFQPFTQADASTSRRFGGTGLGLSIVKKLLTAMGGNIRVDSQEGFGTTFTVTLSCPQSHIIPEPPAAPPSNTHMGILLAEDNPVTQTLVKRMLKDYSIDTADNGEMALNMVKASPYKYTVLLCDLNMPVMDGLEATREIRKLEHGKNIYIVGLTANAFKTDRDACLEAGMDDFLSKPFTKAGLLGIIGKGKVTRRSSGLRLAVSEFGVLQDGERSLPPLAPATSMQFPSIQSPLAPASSTHFLSTQ